jgi:hypothetical protein
MEGSVLHVTFTSRDTFSAIKRAEFSVDAGEWQFVEPVGQLSDAKMEAYDFNAPLPQVLVSEPAVDKAKSKRQKMGAAESDTAQTISTTQPDPVLLSNEHVVVVRVFDRFDNVGIAKIVIK